MRARTIGSLRLIFAVLAMIAIGWQLTIHLQLGFRAINFFSYFTNLSNLFAAIVLLLGVKHASGKNVPSMRDDWLRAAAVISMSVVGIVFALLLRDVDLGALRPWINIVLHYVMPVVLLIDWMLRPPRHRLGVRQLAAIAVLPIAYLVYTVLRGAATGWYPYPFLDPAQTNGYFTVAVYSIGIAALFLLVGWLLIALGNWRAISFAAHAD